MKVIGQQAITIQLERVPLLRRDQGLKESAIIVGFEKNGDAVVAPVKGMVKETIGDRTAWTRHGVYDIARDLPGLEKKELTPISCLPFCCIVQKEYKVQLDGIKYLDAKNTARSGRTSSAGPGR
jgi:hypothetical protein